jgi:hypothetical protein
LPGQIFGGTGILIAHRLEDLPMLVEVPYPIRNEPAYRALLPAARREQRVDHLEQHRIARRTSEELTM